MFGTAVPAIALMGAALVRLALPGVAGPGVDLDEQEASLAP